MESTGRIIYIIADRIVSGLKFAVSAIAVLPYSNQIHATLIPLLSRYPSLVSLYLVITFDDKPPERSEGRKACSFRR